jgi:hypothetical protein
MAKLTKQFLQGPLRGDLVIAVKCLELEARYDPTPTLSFQPFASADANRVPTGHTLPSGGLLQGFIVVVSAPTMKVELSDEAYYGRVRYLADEWLNRISVASGLPTASGGWWHIGLPTGSVIYGLDFSEATGVLLSAGTTNSETLERALAYRRDELHSLRFALNRYRSAMYEQQDPAATAVDIGIAWEALLLCGEESKSEIALRVALRGTHLIGGDGATREQTFAVLKRAYDTRSRIVHDGGIERDEREFRQQNQEAIDLFTLAARKVLTTGLPTKDDWTRMMVGSD